MPCTYKPEERRLRPMPKNRRTVRDSIENLRDPTWLTKTELADAMSISPRTIDGWNERFGQRNTADPFMFVNSVRIPQGNRTLVFHTPTQARAIANRWWKVLRLPRRCMQ